MGIINQTSGRHSKNVDFVLIEIHIKGKIRCRFIAAPSLLPVL